MASSTQRQSEEVLVDWQRMRNYWIYSAGKISDDKANNVKTYVNTFVRNNPRFSFTVTQLYDELFYICITTEQCLMIKRDLEKKFKIELPDARTQELFPGGARQQKSFNDHRDFRSLSQHGLLELNKPVIMRKHQEARDHFTKVRNAFRRQDGKSFLAFDIEVFEHDHSQVLEIGYVVVRFSPARHNTQDALPKPVVTSRQHLIIEENLRYKNKDNVPDNRDGFVFGVSETLSMADAVEKFRYDVIGCDFILGQSVQHDEDYLKEIGVDLRALGKEMFDTQMIQTYKESRVNSDKYFMRGLAYLLKEYKLNYQDSHLHNGGCDAFYTMMVFLRQMEYSVEQVNDIIAS